MKFTTWFFAMSEATLVDPGYTNMIYPMIASQKANAPDLVPHLLYDGELGDFTKTLSDLGVNVIQHEFSQLNVIKTDPRWTQPGFERIARGSYLRFDVPLLIEKMDLDKECVLYTDMDVLFLRPPIPIPLGNAPFACGPEFDQENYVDINTGVMHMNVDKMLETRPALITYLQQHHTTTGAFDQCILRGFYAGQWAKLPIDHNWKPYWGVREHAAIVHYHGPKPYMRDSPHVAPPIKELQRDGYFYYCNLFDDYRQLFERYKS